MFKSIVLLNPNCVRVCERERKGERVGKCAHVVYSLKKLNIVCMYRSNCMNLVILSDKQKWTHTSPLPHTARAHEELRHHNRGGVPSYAINTSMLHMTHYICSVHLAAICLHTHTHTHTVNASLQISLRY